MISASAANGSFTFATPVAGGGAYQRDGQDQPVRAVLRGLQRVGHGGRRERHQRRRSPARQFATYTIGGAVSGLSGTVVLQDNGGDELSVSGERLVHVRDAGGRRRGRTSVTVKTNPSGQSCAVSSRLGHGGRGQCHQRRGLLHGQLGDVRV